MLFVLTTLYNLINISTSRLSGVSCNGYEIFENIIKEVPNDKLLS